MGADQKVRRLEGSIEPKATQYQCVIKNEILPTVDLFHGGEQRYHVTVTDILFCPSNTSG